MNFKSNPPAIYHEPSVLSCKIVQVSDQDLQRCLLLLTGTIPSALLVVILV